MQSSTSKVQPVVQLEFCRFNYTTKFFTGCNRYIIIRSVTYLWTTNRNRSVAAQVVTDTYATGMLIVYLIQACRLKYAFMLSMQYKFTGCSGATEA